MKAWRFHEFGNISNLHMEEIEVPLPAADEALLRVLYAGLNQADRFLVMGIYSGAGTPPFSVGRDGCGIVVQPGSSDRFKKGDLVVCLRSNVGITREGTLAEYVAVPEAHLAHLPDWWSPEDGAAGTHALLTGWQALKQVANVQTGEMVIISGASGGVGLSALIIAKALGARVTALSRSREKRDKMLMLGADLVFDTYDKGIVEKVKGAGGADVIVDNVCGEFLQKGLVMAKDYARICVIGALGGIKCEIDPTRLIFKRLQVHGIQVAMYSDAGVRKAWNDIVKLIKPLEAKVPIDKAFPFEEVQEAFEYMRHGPMGKVVVGPMNS